MARETEHCGKSKYAAPRTSARFYSNRLRKQIDGYRFMSGTKPHDYSADNTYFPRTISWCRLWPPAVAFKTQD